MKTDTIIILMLAACMLSTPVMLVANLFTKIDPMLVFAPWLFVVFVTTICLAAFGFLMIQGFGGTDWRF